jgi:hypothetical protein
MGPIKTSIMTKQFKRVFDERALNALGKATRLCRREREATPYRLLVTLVEAFAVGKLDSIADIHRAFNAVCERHVHYKPFHNQLSKAGFPIFMREALSRLFNEQACEVLRFSRVSPLARSEHLRVQDGTSFVLKSTLADTFPGRFTNSAPAAVELHVDLDLMSEMANRVVLSADKETERQFLPEVEDVAGGLLLGDAGYFGKVYLRSLDQAGRSFIVRGTANLNPVIIKAVGPDGREIKRFINQRLKAVKSRLSKIEWVDMNVRFDTRAGGPFECRLVVHPNLRRDEAPRYLVSNLDREAFSTEQTSDGYRLRWQIELLFKEWKSHSNLHAFGTANSNIAEGLIWASLCAATVTRYCVHMTQRIARIAISTSIVAKCIRRVLGDMLYDLIHQPRRLRHSVKRAVDYLSRNARRAHPHRDKKTGRLKQGLFHVFADA